MELIDRGDHYVELKDDGTYKRHHSKFISHGGMLIRVDKDPVTKAETISLFTPLSLITADKTTGEIKQHQNGFIVEHELIGPGPHPDLTLEYVQAVLPEDFTFKGLVDVIETAPDGTKTTLPDQEEITRTAYKVVARKLVKLTTAKLNEPIKRAAK